MGYGPLWYHRSLLLLPGAPSIVGNLSTDAASSQKVWYFVRIAAQSLTAVTEVALQTHPHILLLAEEVVAQQMGLPEVTAMICYTIEARAENNKNYGIVLIPHKLL